MMIMLVGHMYDMEFDCLILCGNVFHSLITMGKMAERYFEVLGGIVSERYWLVQQWGVRYIRETVVDFEEYYYFRI